MALFLERINKRLFSFCSQECLMDLPLRTISYIADIGNMVVLMARGKMVRSHSAQENLNQSSESSSAQDDRRLYRMICHVFESEDVSPPPGSTVHTVFLTVLIITRCFCPAPGPADCSVHRSVLQCGLPGVPQSERHWPWGSESERVQWSAQHSGHVQRWPHTLLQVWELQRRKSGNRGQRSWSTLTTFSTFSKQYPLLCFCCDFNICNMSQKLVWTTYLRSVDLLRFT